MSEGYSVSEGWSDRDEAVFYAGLVYGSLCSFEEAWDKWNELAGGKGFRREFLKWLDDRCEQYGVLDSNIEGDLFPPGEVYDDFDSFVRDLDASGR